jgi:lantibiotic modifying enzyme
MTTTAALSWTRAPAVVDDSEFASAARSLVARVVSLARVDRSGAPVWTGDDIDPRSAPDLSTPPMLVHGPLDDGLLTGRAGIAVVLSAASRLPGAPAEWAPLAVRTAEAAVRRATSDLGPHGQPGSEVGWDSGALGISRAATVVAATHRSADLAERSRHLGGLAVRRVVDHPEWLPPFADLMGGLAGILAGVASVSLAPSDESARADAIALLVDRIGALSLAGPIGRLWPMAGADHGVVGLAHGGSGIALALTGAAQRLGGSEWPPSDPGTPARAASLASTAVLWEDSLHDAGAGGWPDLRLPEPVPGLAWCHGAPGVGVSAALRHPLVVGADAEARDAAAAHVAFVRARAASAAHRPVGLHPFDGSLCHGLAGVVEMHLLAAQAWPAAAREHVAEARAVATHLTRAGRPGHPTWQCGIRSGGRSPNVLVGIGGVALTLARCHDLSVAPSAADPFLGALAPRG